MAVSGVDSSSPFPGVGNLGGDGAISALLFGLPQGLLGRRSPRAQIHAWLQDRYPRAGRRLKGCSRGQVPDLLEFLQGVGGERLQLVVVEIIEDHREFVSIDAPQPVRLPEALL